MKNEYSKYIDPDFLRSKEILALIISISIVYISVAALHVVTSWDITMAYIGNWNSTVRFIFAVYSILSYIGAANDYNDM